MTKEEYIANHPEINYKCPYCDKDKKFYSNGWEGDGFRGTCCSDDCRSKLQSDNAKHQWANTPLEKHPFHIYAQQEGVSEERSWWAKYRYEIGKNPFYKINNDRANLWSKNHPNKESHGYGSEWYQRIDNRNRYRSMCKANGYTTALLYVLDFGNSLKIGITQDMAVRWGDIKYKQLYLFNDTVDIITELERTSLWHFKDYTIEYEDGTGWTEYLDKKCLDEVIEYFDNYSKTKELDKLDDIITE